MFKVLNQTQTPILGVVLAALISFALGAAADAQRYLSDQRPIATNVDKLYSAFDDDGDAVLPTDAGTLTRKCMGQRSASN